MPGAAREHPIPLPDRQECHVTTVDALDARPFNDDQDHAAHTRLDPTPPNDAEAELSVLGGELLSKGATATSW
jgi:hypothetical protein